MPVPHAAAQHREPDVVGILDQSHGFGSHRAQKFIPTLNPSFLLHAIIVKKKAKIAYF
jgi:hypothetical protein